MNPLDDLFRDGLQGRAGEVPEDMWSRIRTGKGAAVPEGTEVDQLFASKLAERAGEVPEDMWSRITSGQPAPIPGGETLDKAFAKGLKERTAEIPVGMWERIWATIGTPTPIAGTQRKWLVAALGLLLLLASGLFWSSLQEVDHQQPLNQDKAGETIALAEEEGLRSPAALSAPAPEGNTQVEQHQSTREAQATTVPSQATPRTVLAPEEVSEMPIRPPAAQITSIIKAADQHLAASGIRTINDQAEPTTPTNELPVAAGPKEREVSGPAIAPMASLPQREAVRVQPALVAEPTVKLKRQTRIAVPEFSSFRSAPRHRFQTELLFGAAYARQEFSALSPDQEFLRQIRETSEFPDLSYQITLRGSYKLSERLLLLGGLTYAEIRNEFENEPIINGQPTLVRTTNRIRQLEAPLLLGFRLPGQRLSVSLNAGPVINLSTSVQGRFLDPDSPQPRDLALEGGYRRNTGFGFMTSLSTTYKIGKKEPFILLVEPFFKAYPTSFTVQGAPLKEKYWVAGLQLGVRKGF